MDIQYYLKILAEWQIVAFKLGQPINDMIDKRAEIGIFKEEIERKKLRRETQIVCKTTESQIISQRLGEGVFF